MILELLSSKFDQMVGYQELIESDQVDEYIYKHYTKQQESNIHEESSKNDQGTDYDTLIQHENQLIQWKKDKRKLQLERRLARLAVLQEQIADEVNDLDKIGESQQVIDHAPDYETTQNRALSMGCVNPVDSNGPCDNPLDDNQHEENSFHFNEDQIQSVNDHCNQIILEQPDKSKRNKPQVSTQQPANEQIVDMQTPFEKSKDYISALTPGQISPPEHERINKSLKSGAQGKEYSLTDDKSFQVSDIDDRNFTLQNPGDPQMFLGLPAQKKADKQLKSNERNSVISEEMSNKEQTPSGFKTRKKQAAEPKGINQDFSFQMKDGMRVSTDKVISSKYYSKEKFSRPDKSISRNENWRREPLNNPRKQKTRRMGTTIKPPESSKQSPFKKSPTQKSRGALKTQQDSESVAASSKFVVKVTNKKLDGVPFTSRGSHKRENEHQQKTSRKDPKADRSKDDKHDQNSSLNLTMDNKLDQLSLNFNQQYISNEKEPHQLYFKNDFTIGDKSLDQEDALKQGTQSNQSQYSKPQVNASQIQKQPIIAQSKNQQFGSRPKIQQNTRYKRSNNVTKQEKSSDMFPGEQARAINDQISNFAKSDSIDCTLNFSPTLSPFDRNENQIQFQKLKLSSRYSTNKRNTIAYQSNPYRPGDMRLAQKPVLQATACRPGKAEKNRKQGQVYEKKPLYSNNLQIHTQDNRNLFKQLGFQKSNPSRQQANSYLNSMDTDRTSHPKQKSVKTSLDHSLNLVQKNNSQGKITQRRYINPASDLKIMPVNIKDTKYHQQNSFCSMSSSHREDNQSKNLTYQLSSIIQNSSGRHVGVSQNNLIDSSLMHSSKHNQINEQIFKIEVQNKNDEVLEVNEAEYERLMLLYKLMQSDKTSNVVHNQLKKRMFNELISQIEKRLSILKAQHNHLLKQKMLCSIYGQKFHAIMYGGVSYKEHYFDVNDQAKARNVDQQAQQSAKYDRPTNQNTESNGTQPNTASQQTSQHPMKQALRTDMNLSKIKDYSDQNYFLAKSTEYNQNQRRSLPFRHSKNSALSQNKSRNVEELQQSRVLSKDRNSGWATNKQQAADEVNYAVENRVGSHTQHREEDTSDSFFEFRNSAHNMFNQTFNQTFNQSNNQNNTANQQHYTLSQELVQSHNFYIQFLALNEKLNYSPKFQNQIKCKIQELEIIEYEIMKLIQLAQRNESQLSQPVQSGQNHASIVSQYVNHKRQRSGIINFSRLNQAQDQMLLSSVPNRSKGSPMNISEGKISNNRLNYNLNKIISHSKSLTQGQKFYQQKYKFLEADALNRPQNLKRAELSRITELHMAGENSQQNIQKPLQSYHRTQQQKRQNTNSRNLIHQDSQSSQHFDGQQGQGKKRSEANLIDLSENVFDSSMAANSVILTGQDKARERYQGNSSQLLNGSIQTNQQQIQSTEQKINHYREKIKKYSNTGVNKIVKPDKMLQSCTNDSQSNMYQDGRNRSRTSHMQTNKLPTIKNIQGSIIESGHKIISEKPSPNRQGSPSKTTLQYQYKNIGSRQRLNQSINPQVSYLLPQPNGQVIEYDMSAQYHAQRTRTNQIRASGHRPQQQQLQQLPQDQHRLLPNVKSSINGQINKFNGQKYSKVLSDYLNSKQDQQL